MTKNGSSALKRRYLRACHMFATTTTTYYHLPGITYTSKYIHHPLRLSPNPLGSTSSSALVLLPNGSSCAGTILITQSQQPDWPDADLADLPLGDHRSSCKSCRKLVLLPLVILAEGSDPRLPRIGTAIALLLLAERMLLRFVGISSLRDLTPLSISRIPRPACCCCRCCCRSCFDRTSCCFVDKFLITAESACSCWFCRCRFENGRSCMYRVKKNTLKHTVHFKNLVISK